MLTHKYISSHIIIKNTVSSFANRLVMSTSSLHLAGKSLCFSEVAPL